MTIGSTVAFSPATAADLEELIAIRIEAMRESLEQLGRFDPVRAGDRLRNGFVPEDTRFILANGARAGFVVVREGNAELLLDHLYVRTSFQGQGIGSAVLERVFGEADARGLPVRVGALRGSASNRFYLRHEFIQVAEEEWDIYYVRWPQGADPI